MAFDQYRGRVMSPKTVAEATDVCVAQVYDWIKEGSLKVVKLGHRMTRINGDSLADFLQSRMDIPLPPRGKHATSTNVSTTPLSEAQHES